jgi:hypothetical protein
LILKCREKKITRNQPKGLARAVKLRRLDIWYLQLRLRFMEGSARMIKLRELDITVTFNQRT